MREIVFFRCVGEDVCCLFGRWQAPWSPLLWNKMKALSLAYKLFFILSKNIVPSRSYRCLKMDVYSEIAHFCDKLASPYIYKV